MSARNNTQKDCTMDNTQLLQLLQNMDLHSHVFEDSRGMKTVNLSPGADDGCFVPFDWLDDFIRLEDGQSCEKAGRAWWYEPPHDQEECLYRAHVEDGILNVEVEVGPEALVRRAQLPVRHIPCD